MKMYYLQIRWSTILPPMYKYDTGEYNFGKGELAKLCSICVHNCKAELYLAGKRILKAEAKAPVSSIDTEAKRIDVPLRDVRLIVENKFPIPVDAAVHVVIWYER